MRVLVLLDALHPSSHHERRVDHDVHLLGMVVRLRVLVAVALNPDVPVDDHQFDVAAALLVLVVDRADLVLGHVRVYVEILGVAGGMEVVVQLVRDHLIVAALAWQEFAGVVVAEAVVVGHLDVAAAGGEDLWQEGLGVEIRGLDEDGFAGVAEGGDPGEVLRDVDGGFAGATVGFTADHGAGEGWVGCDGDDRGHCLRGRCEVWSGSLGIGLDGSVQQPGNGVETGLARARFEVGYRAEDFAAEIEVEMRVSGGVKGEVLFGAFGSDLGQGFGASRYWVVPGAG